MPKPSRGLPKGFELNVPVELGDYLDEQTPEAHVDSPIQPAASTRSAHRGGDSGDFGTVSAISSAKPEENPAKPEANPPLTRISPPRKQFNMTPDTLRMVDELLIHIRNHSGERDVRASELFNALVLTVHEVRSFLDLSRVPARGQWGSASAAALPIALKEAFQEAISISKLRR